MGKIDLDRLVCDFMNAGNLLNAEDRREIQDRAVDYKRYPQRVIGMAVRIALRQQGLRIEDGRLVETGGAEPDGKD